MAEIDNVISVAVHLGQIEIHLNFQLGNLSVDYQMEFLRRLSEIDVSQRAAQPRPAQSGAELQGHAMGRALLVPEEAKAEKAAAAAKSGSLFAGLQ